MSLQWYNMVSSKQSNTYKWNNIVISTHDTMMSKILLISILDLRKEFEVPPYSQSVDLRSQIELRCHPPKGVPKPRVSRTYSIDMPYVPMYSTYHGLESGLPVSMYMNICITRLSHIPKNKAADTNVRYLGSLWSNLTADSLRYFFLVPKDIRNVMLP